MFWLTLLFYLILNFTLIHSTNYEEKKYFFKFNFNGNCDDKL